MRLQWQVRIPVHHVSESGHELVRARDGESRRQDGLNERRRAPRGLVRQGAAVVRGSARRTGRIGTSGPHERDIVFRIGKTLLRRLLLVVIGAVAVHVALADEGALAAAVADRGEDLGRRVNRAVPAAGRRSRADDALDHRVVHAAGVRGIGKLFIATHQSCLQGTLATLGRPAHLGFGRKGQVRQPIEQLILLSVSEIQILRRVSMGIDQAEEASGSVRVRDPRLRSALNESPGHQELVPSQVDPLHVLRRPAVRLQPLLDLLRLNRPLDECDPPRFVDAEERIVDVLDLGKRE